ncbi:MAG TPA: acyl carrier protein [Candidatus Dormibacteraeota bacterium]|nr:acyl carrier protein [Candidatus Dormibacteraeota bacterium]
MDAEFVALLRPFLRYAGDGDITGDSRLRDLGLDSMRAIDLLFAVEEVYGLVVPDEKLVDSTFETCASLWTTIQELRAADGRDGSA